MAGTSAEILAFWFSEIPHDKWWEKDAAFDVSIKQRFSEAHQAATRGELFRWRDSLKGRLAEIIVLDQFSRNMHRGTALAFANDAQALTLAQEAVRDEGRHRLGADEKAFLYMPYMHSESPRVHEVALSLFAEKGLEEYLPYELSHHELIKTFGRFPHRNAALNRSSTAAELRYLSETSDY
jgi:uncharacterized protein (DUF924 family)